VNSGWSVSVEFPGVPTRSGVPIVEEPCVDVTSTQVDPSGRTTVQMFAEADNEDDARERALRVASKVARNLGLADTHRNVTLEPQRTFL
jgi:hypothetical protein